MIMVVIKEKTVSLSSCTDDSQSILMGRVRYWMIKRSEQNRLSESENLFVCVDEGVLCMNVIATKLLE